MSKTTLSVPEQHQKRIAYATLKMSDVGARIMGGMTKDEARTFLRKHGLYKGAIKKIDETPEVELPDVVDDTPIGAG
jgi:hypothetical protein